jgi:hypothetical protein
MGRDFSKKNIDKNNIFKFSKDNVISKLIFELEIQKLFNRVLSFMMILWGEKRGFICFRVDFYFIQINLIPLFYSCSVDERFGFLVKLKKTFRNLKKDINTVVTSCRKLIHDFI